jgi:cobalamin biosynthesis Co2+ chelatase CbiK
MFRRKVLNSEPKFVLKVGHDRYGNLIIKELKVSGDNLEEVIAQVQEGINQFTQIAVEKVLGIE